MTKKLTPSPKQATNRQKNYLDRLAGGEGKRQVVDLDAEACVALEQLLSSGYGSTQKAVVNRALKEIAASHTKK